MRYGSGGSVWRQQSPKVQSSSSDREVQSNLVQSAHLPPIIFLPRNTLTETPLASTTTFALTDSARHVQTTRQNVEPIREPEQRPHLGGNPYVEANPPHTQQSGGMRKMRHGNIGPMDA